MRMFTSWDSTRGNLDVILCILVSDLDSLAWLPLFGRIIQVLQILKLDRKTLCSLQIDRTRAEDLEDVLNDLFRFDCRSQAVTLA
jgi:hypothetical protein